MNQAAEAMMPSAAENLRRSFELTEAARAKMAEEIAAAHPDWSAREVELERNRRWLRQACEGEPCDRPTTVIYEMLCFRGDGTQGSLNRAASIVASETTPFRDHLAKVANQLGVADEWQRVKALVDSN